MTHARRSEEGPGVERIYLLARTGGLTVAVPAASPPAVFRLDNLTPAPGAPVPIIGVANTSHGVVAVACLARWLNLDAPASAIGAPVMLVPHGSDLVALAVEEIDEAIMARQEDVAPTAADASSPLSAAVSGVLRLGFARIPVLDVSTLFASPPSPKE